MSPEDRKSASPLWRARLCGVTPASFLKEAIAGMSRQEETYTFLTVSGNINTKNPHKNRNNITTLHHIFCYQTRLHVYYERQKINIKKKNCVTGFFSGTKEHIILSYLTCYHHRFKSSIRCFSFHFHRQSQPLHWLLKRSQLRIW